MKFYQLATVSTLALFMAACGSSSGSSASSTPSTPSTPSTTTPTTTSTNSCPQHIIAGASLGITALPSDAASQYKSNFCKYTKLTAPNGKPIHFYAQDKITNEQLVRARRILAFFLENVAGSQYGADKTAVFNSMADNNATLVMGNGSDEGGSPAGDAEGQPLYETENIIEGSAAYFSGEPRDAAYEEILHLMHITGFGINGVSNGVFLNTYQLEIKDAMQDAIAPNVLAAGTGTQSGLWASTELEWLRELKAEGSLTAEYIASVIDTYYGLTGKASPGGSYFLYKPQSREEVKSMDPKGWALVGGDSPRKFFSEYVTRTVRMDASYNGTFEMVLDTTKPYTYKSRFLMNIQLMGNNNANINGNAQNNIFGSNAGNNRFDGKEGNDTVKYHGPQAEYTVTNESDGSVSVTDSNTSRDGKDTLFNIEKIVFSDGELLL